VHPIFVAQMTLKGGFVPSFLLAEDDRVFQQAINDCENLSA